MLVSFIKVLLMPERRVSTYMRLIAKSHGIISFLLSQRLRSRYGVVISDRARISETVRLVHYSGVIIGEGVVIGARTRIYQHVTLGQNHGKYPHIGEDVIVYAGAVICGQITVGSGAVIGANAVVTRDVEPNSIVAGVPARVIGYRKGDELLF